MPKQTLAVFDFDGTITTNDTFLGFCLFSSGFCGCAAKLIRAVPVCAGYGLGMLSAHAAKEKIFSIFFRGMAASEFSALCAAYCANRLARSCRPQALDRIAWHKNEKHKLVIASASPESWIKPWADANGFDDVIATIPEIRNGALTGNFASPNCNGTEKVVRLLRKYKREDCVIYAYGDSSGDKPLLAIADHGFYKAF